MLVVGDRVEEERRCWWNEDEVVGIGDVDDCGMGTELGGTGTSKRFVIIER